MKNIVKKIFELIKSDIDYKKYWDNRYRSGDTSGAGSYGKLAQFKTDIINSFLYKYTITNVIEFGCGDGNQLKSIHYPKYLGMDVAQSSVSECISTFGGDNKKSFMIYDPTLFVNNGWIMAELTVCLDVLYHIIDEEDFLKTLKDIFESSSKYVILYTSIDAFKEEPYKKGTHVRHRDTLSYLLKFEQFKIVEIINQRYPELSSASFIMLERVNFEK